KPGRPASLAAASKDRRGDLWMAAAGIALGLTCALFPWYIFFNQEKFGVRAMQFEGNADQQAGPIALGSQPPPLSDAKEAPAIPPEMLDLFATGTTPPREEPAAPETAEQPFPAPVAS